MKEEGRESLLSRTPSPPSFAPGWVPFPGWSGSVFPGSGLLRKGLYPLIPLYRGEGQRPGSSSLANRGTQENRDL